MGIRHELLCAVVITLSVLVIIVTLRMLMDWGVIEGVEWEWLQTALNLLHGVALLYLT